MFLNLQMGAKMMICALAETPLTSVVGLAHRLRRQLQAADAIQIPYALIVGPDEVSQQQYPIKDRASREQQALDEAGVIKALQDDASSMSPAIAGDHVSSALAIPTPGDAGGDREQNQILRDKHVDQRIG